MANNEKVIKLLFAAAAMILAIVVAVTIKQGNGEKTTEPLQETSMEFMEDTSDQEETEISEESITVPEEETTMEVAPTDSSDWEIHKAADDEPDTGETIPD